MLWFLLIFSVLACQATVMTRNHLCKQSVKNNGDLYIFNAFSAGISTVCLIAVTAIQGQLHMPSGYTLIMGAGFGVITALGALLNMKALETGPLSYTTVITNCSMVLPALSGLILYGEPVAAVQWIAIAMMLVSVFCSVDESGGGSGTSFKWLLLCMCAFLCNGGIGVMQKLHQSSVYKEEIGAFLVVAFVVNGLLSLLLALRSRGQGQTITITRPGSAFLIFGLLTGAGVAANNQINLYLSGVMPSIIFYPVVNGLGMLLSCGAGLVLWREKLTKKQMLGLISGTVAILMLCF